MTQQNYREILLDTSFCPWPSTNESLEAITRALTVRGDDKVIAICGCGAQPLALLENLGEQGEVIAIDNNIQQIKYAQALVECLKQGDFVEFCRPHIAPFDDFYFFPKERLEKIVANLDKLHFSVMDVTQKPRIHNYFSKGYFSNTPVNLKYFHQAFKEGALIYLTCGSPGARTQFLEFNARDLYALDKEKTELASKIETSKYDWTPVVLRKQ